MIDEPTFRNKLYVFNDRFHAGVLLAEKLMDYKSEKNVYLLAIPAGGIQVSYGTSIIGLPHIVPGYPRSTIGSYAAVFKNFVGNIR